MYTSKTNIMTEQNSNPDSLTWTHTRSSLSAETFGNPASSLDMDCHICVKNGDKFSGVPARALWDTGTSTTVISTTIAAKLGLQPVGKMRINGLGGIQHSWVTTAFLRFPNGTVAGPFYMAVHDLPSTDVLIGMDVISMGTFHLERKPDGGTRFTFTL